MSITGKVKEKALDLGFDVVGVTAASALGDGERQAFEKWLQGGFAGALGYMHRNLDKRIDPRRLVDGAKSVVVVGLNYKFAEEGSTMTERDEPCGRVARYARYEDYHGFLARLLGQLKEYIAAEVGTAAHCKVCVDSAPLAERAFAVRAGLGFIGRNHMLINPELGPEILLGELVTNVELEVDEHLDCDCAGCRRCIKACPTGALRTDGQFDARRCISYLTIEYNGQIEDDLAGKIGNRLFGCDECVLACPYQHKAPIRRNTVIKYCPERSTLVPSEILSMTSECFKRLFGDSPLLRTGLERLKRNARIFLGEQ